MSIAKTYKYNSFGGICVTLLLFGSPNIILALQNIICGSYYAFLLNIFHFLITSGLLFLPLVIFKLPVKRYFFIISPIFTLVPALLFVAILYHRLPTRSIFYIVFEAQQLEIAEFLSGTTLWKILIIVTPLLVIISSATLIDPKLVLNRRIKILYVIFYLSLFVFTLGFKTIQRKTIHKTLQASYRSYIRDTPIHISKRFIKAYKSFKTNNSHNYTNNYTQAKIKNTNNKREVYILVLGESSRFKNWGINDYERNTSPNLRMQKNLISYNCIISPSFNTNKSIPIILTTQTAKNFYSGSLYTSIIEVFKQVGFKTYWFSSQTSKGTTIGTIASNTDDLYEAIHSNNSNYDGKLLNQIEEVLNKNELKTLLIIHTWGNHYPYQKRYPEEFEGFTPALKKNKHIPTNRKHRKAIINSYDNSILYTDYFLSEVIGLVNKDSIISMLTYVSDHGENLFDDENIGFGRGYGKLTQELFHIPLFFWASDAYISSNSFKWKTLNYNKTVKSTTESILHTISDMAGISWNNYDSTQSFANQYYKHTGRFILYKNKAINYDSFFNTIKESQLETR